MITVEQSYRPPGPVATQFHHSTLRRRLLMGPLGCVAANTRIQTKAGLVRIDSLADGVQILSWDEKNNRFVYALSGRAILKGTDYLYRISMLQGEFAAAGHHRVLCADGKYQYVGDLSVGDTLSSCAFPLQQTIMGGLLGYLINARHWMQTSVNSLANYAKSNRLYGLLSQWVVSNDRAFFLAQGDALLLSQQSGLSCKWHRDAQKEQTPLHNHRKLFDGLKYKPGYSSLVAKPSDFPFYDGEGLKLKQDSLQSLAAIQVCLRLPGMFLSRHMRRLSRLVNVLVSSLSCSISETSIISVERLEKKQEYWDIQVEGTHNYITEDGSIHHNSGKTVAVIHEILQLMCEQPKDRNGIRRSRWAAIRNTYPDLTGTTVKDWLEIAGEEKGRMVYSVPPTHTLRFTIEDGSTVEAEMIFIALDRPVHVKKLRGYQLTGVWLNEIKELPFAIVRMAFARCGRFPKKTEVDSYWYGMLGDTNAPDEDHWYYRLAEKERPEGWGFFRQPGAVRKVDDKWEVNPAAENLTRLQDSYYPEQLHGNTEDWIKVNLANEYGYVNDGKPIHPDFVDSFHVSKELIKPIPGLTVYVGQDYGLTPAAAFAQRSPATGQWRFFKEIVCEDAGALQLAEEMGPYMRGELAGYEFEVWGDPSGEAGSQADSEQNVFKILQANGIMARPCHSNDPVLRRAALSAQLRKVKRGEPGILLCPSMTIARKGLAGAFCYRRVQVAGDERYRDKPDKTPYSHICEAIEYLLMGAGEGRAVIINKLANTKPITVKSDYNIFR